MERFDEDLRERDLRDRAEGQWASGSTRDRVEFLATTNTAATIATGLSPHERPGTVRLAGAHRARVVEPLLPGARTLRLWTDDGAGVTAWEIEHENARFFLVLSPETHRGFSGEGQLLERLVDRHHDLPKALRLVLAEEGRDGYRMRLPVVAALSLGLGPRPDYFPILWERLPEADRVLARVLADRRPPWLCAWLDAQIEVGFSGFTWTLVDGLVRAGPRRCLSTSRLVAAVSHPYGVDLGRPSPTARSDRASSLRHRSRPARATRGRAVGGLLGRNRQLPLVQ